MIIDSHAHVILPPQRLIDIMDEAGIDQTILFPTSVHPEHATNMESLDLEMQALNGLWLAKPAPWRFSSFRRKNK
ncbi:MAG TPA: hypothetical protein VN426_04120 [Syntrophomonadaceae bacterium]|nr:hypothetical protein [Syntrophomonadaceae bacterium]